jgi:hypothetical protein
MYIHAHMYIYLYICMCMYTYLHVHIYTHINVRTFSTFSAQCIVARSALSPAKNKVRRQERSKLAGSKPWASALFRTRIAVGAVKRAFTLCLSMVRQKFDASGVPIGFPS